MLTTRGMWCVGPAAAETRAVRVRWEDTDLHKCGGLSTARSGGGLHAELVGLRTNLLTPSSLASPAVSSLGKGDKPGNKDDVLPMV